MQTLVIGVINQLGYLGGPPRKHGLVGDEITNLDPHIPPCMFLGKGMVCFLVKEWWFSNPSRFVSSGAGSHMPRDKHWWQRHKSWSYEVTLLIDVHWFQRLWFALVCFFRRRCNLFWNMYLIQYSSFILSPILKPTYMLHHFPSLFISVQHCSSCSIIFPCQKFPCFGILKQSIDGNFTRPRGLPRSIRPSMVGEMPVMP